VYEGFNSFNVFGFSESFGSFYPITALKLNYHGMKGDGLAWGGCLTRVGAGSMGAAEHA